ncbi:MAG: hypothetical protein RL577_1155, partial [Bacteroidota bacterium]
GVLNNRNDMALVGSRGQFRHHSTPSFMHWLTRGFIGKDFAFFPNGGRSIIAAALNAQYGGIAVHV